ncbi:hypothetical protein [Adlercreutzia sp. ZJ154]|uniref:hypothetical protein n=1 Tax=Adlercreutzia sp. ZJ154 TaxID=2709790 RepID=UPI0013EB4035|nr:hypothetical protein [Adlercreutzia sp. ZJ154]
MMNIKGQIDMSDTTMLKRAASVVLSTTLACSLAPFAAFADENNKGNAADATDSKTNTTNVQTQEGANALVATPIEVQDVVRASVPVNLDADIATMLTYNDLNYVADEATATATLVGFSTSPEGALEIPAQVVSGEKTYTVTNISSNIEMGGGVLRF